VLFAGFVEMGRYNLVVRIWNRWPSSELTDLRGSMQNGMLLVLGCLVLVPRPRLLGQTSQGHNGSVEKSSATNDPANRSIWIGQDLHLAGKELASFKLSTDEHVLMFEQGFSASIGADQFTSDKAVVWLEPVTSRIRDLVLTEYKGQMYLQDNISTKKIRGASVTDLSQTMLKKGESMLLRLTVSGDVFATVEERKTADPRDSELYARALAAVEPGALQIPPETEETAPKPPTETTEHETPVDKKIQKRAQASPNPGVEKAPFVNVVNIAPAGEASLVVESAKAPDGTDIITVIGRVYLWWQQVNERTGRTLLLELQTDNAVIWHEPNAVAWEPGPGAGSTSQENVSAIYVSGNVVMTEGQRTIQADEIYYDLVQKKALAINAVLRSFDVSRGIPIYVRAAKLRQLAENKFEAKDITLTTSEFHVPQVSLSASDVTIIDTTSIDQQSGEVSDSSYDVQMHDVRFNVYDNTILAWPVARSNLQRPDVPLKSVRTGHDSTWGTSVETRWYLARLLGLRETEGTDSTFSLDYYDKRGLGSGVEIDYVKENYFGRILVYTIHDHGEDRLGRNPSRKDIEPPRKSRGRFLFQHRHFLPYNWQLTTEASYLSDENFLEQYYRGEFNAGKEQETLIHLKRIEDNWGFSFLAKSRVNDFANKLEEMPGAEFHWTGQSLFDDRLTFYSDSQIGRFRHRFGSDSTPTGEQSFYTMTSTRNELDMPLAVGRSKVVPFAAVTLGYDDGSGFQTDIDGVTEELSKEIWIGEMGVRLSPQPFWKVYPNVKSRLWDLNQLRHIIQPRAVAVAFGQSDAVAEQRDTLNVGLSQRLQTKRGSGDKQRTVDWMRLDLDFTWVNDSGDASAGPDRFIWNRPFIPLVNRYTSMMPPQDRRSSNIYGPRRNYFSADFLWRLSDTASMLSDMYVDMQSGVVQQFNIGFSRVRWPNLSYYIGSRYLKRIDNGLGQKGSNAFTFAATYVIDPRYTIVFSQQFDFDYDANIRSDITLIRRYHRICFGLTFSADESLDERSIVFSLWPQGVPELAVGLRRYMGLGDSAYY